MQNTGTAVATPTSNSAAPITTNYLDTEIQDMLKELSEASKASKISGLAKAYNTATANLNTQQAGLKDTYYNQRNQVAGNSDVGALNFAQYMASRGIKGNAGAMPEIYRNAGLQNQLGALGQQEAQANTNIDNQRTTLKNNYASDIASAKSSAASEYLQNAINQANTDRTYLTDQLAAQKQEYANNISAYYDDYQAEINNVQNDNDTSNDWQLPYLQAARNAKRQEQAQAQAAAEEKALALNTAAEQTAFTNALNAFKASGVASKAVADILGIPEGSRTADYDIARIQASLEQQKINKSGSKSGEIDYESDDTYWANVKDIQSGMITLDNITQMKDQLVAAYGQEGYIALYREAMKQ